MKLDIEAMAREAGPLLRSPPDWWMEAFARLIVERCAQECDKKNPHPDEYSDQAEYTERRVALSCAAAIRNLLED